MTLDEKRQVIEVLMCCTDPFDGEVTACRAPGIIGCSNRISRLAEAEWNRVDVLAYPEITNENAAADYIEAAYRLIESSPTLRREWFGVA